MIRFDAVKLSQRMDANETLFFARQLEEIEAILYQIKLRELKYRQFIPVSNRDNPGAESITYRQFDKVGMASVIGNYADDLPRADVFGKEYTQKVKGLGLSFGYSTQEIRAARMKNIDLDGMKASAVRRSIREMESKIAWNGDVASGLQGLLDNANVPVQAVPTGTGGYTWALKTADEIILDIRLGTSKIRTQSKGVHQADTMLLPIAQYDIAAGLPRSTHSDTTVLQFILDNKAAFGLTTIDTLPIELELAFTGGTEDGAIIYEKSKEVLELRIPLEMETRPVQEKGLEFIIPCESRIGGVVIRYPLAMCFLTGI